MDYQAQGLAWANSISAFFQTAYLGFCMKKLDVKATCTESLSTSDLPSNHVHCHCFFAGAVWVS